MSRSAKKVSSAAKLEEESRLTLPKVTIVIPTFNSERTVDLCLHSVKNQLYLNTETIVVDNYSRDKTLQAIKRFNVRPLIKGPERSAQKNWGAANAKGSFLLFLDSDMELTPKVVEECVTNSIKKKVDAIVIPQVSVAEGFWSECRKIERESFLGNRFVEAPRFYKRDVFQNLGGFDEELSFGEDSDLYIRTETSGYRISRIQSEIKHYEGELTLGQVIIKAYYYGKTLLKFVRKHPSFTVKKHSPLHQVYVSNMNLVLKDPKHFAGILIMKFIEYATYAIGVSAQIIFRN
jgi:glycosyltransferase involved in cell wall biosynthesis